MRSWVAVLLSLGLLIGGLWSCIAHLWSWLSQTAEVQYAELSRAFAELGYEPTGDLSAPYGLLMLVDLRLRATYEVALTLLCTGFGVGACEAALSRGERFILNYVGTALTVMSFGWAFLYLGLEVLTPPGTSTGYIRYAPLGLALAAVPLGYLTVSQFRRLGSEVKI